MLHGVERLDEVQGEHVDVAVIRQLHQDNVNERNDGN